MRKSRAYQFAHEPPSLVTMGLAASGPTGFGAEQADCACDERKIVRQHVLAEQGLGHAGAEQIGGFEDFIGGSAGSRTDQGLQLFS